MDYNKVVENLILKEIDNHYTFGGLISNLSGVYPTVAKETIERLIKLGKITKSQEANLYIDEKEQLEIEEGILDDLEILPLPHPLDYEWRYSFQTRAFLRKELESKSNNKSVLLIGAPTIYLELKSKESKMNIRLLDYDDKTIDLLNNKYSSNELFKYDVFEYDPPEIKANVVLIDPPWYNNHFKSFLWTSSVCLEIGGSILLSFPSIGTRPGVPDELIEIVGYANSIGLELDKHLSQVLRYTSPYFEYNSLNNIGFHNIPLNWRQGDLLIFNKVRKLESNKEHKVNNTFNGDKWNEVEIDGLRFRVKEGKNSKIQHCRLESIVRGDVLPTVSSRFDSREKAVLWTTGNRIFKSDCPMVLLEILNLIKTGLSKSDLKNNPTRLSNMAFSSIFKQIERIIKTEKIELRNYLNMELKQ